MALCSAIAIENDQLPEWIELVPAGRFQGRDGRAWNNSDPAAVVAAFEQLAQDLPVDIEHSTEIKAKSGVRLPLAGLARLKSVLVLSGVESHGLMPGQPRSTLANTVITHLFFITTTLAMCWRWPLSG